MTLTKTERLARQRVRRKIKRLSAYKSKWPEEWSSEKARHSRGPLVALQHQVHELQLILFRENNKDGWLHERDELTIISERSLEAADIDRVINEDYFK